MKTQRVASFKTKLDCQDEGMTHLTRTGRKPFPAGTRVRDQHTVAVKLPDAEWEKLQEISRILGIREGRFASNHVIEMIQAINLDHLRAEQGQESLDIAKAS